MESYFSSYESGASKTSNEEVSPKTLETCRDIISTLPREEGLRMFSDLYLYQGFWYYSYLLEGVIFAQEHYKAQPSDILIASVPKTGTTWLKALTFSIVTRTQFDSSTTPLLTKNPHHCVPFMEIDFSRKGIKPEPGSVPLISTHMPYASLPKSIIDSGCKIVYMSRDPKDSFVSLWHFVSKLRPGDQEQMSLEETFDFFCKGKSDYGPYWEHILSYWKASLEQPEKILFLKYEDVIADSKFYVKRMAEFMGCPFSLEEDKEGKIQELVELCSFENMSNLEVNKNGTYTSDRNVVENKTFFRKGKTGDWKNYLTPEMADRLDKITHEKLGGFGLSFQSP